MPAETQIAKKSPPLRRSAIRIATVAVAIAVLAAIGVPILLGGSDSSPDVPTVKGIVLEPLFEGDDPIDLGTLRGRPIVINAFASTCPPCIEEMPEFQRVSQDLIGRVAFIGLDVVDFPPAGRDLVRKTGVTYPTGLDPVAGTFVALGGLNTSTGPVLPHTFFVDDEGNVVKAFGGRIPERELRRLISELFGVEASG